MEDCGNRKFICVQLLEITDEKSDAYKAGYTTIADICKDRIRKIGDAIISEKTAELEKLEKSIEGKILQEETQEQIDTLQLTINNLDTGFKDDIAKTNSIQILRQYGIEEVNSI